MSTREAVICEPVRTPIGRYGGMFKSLTAVDLGVAALKGLLERTGVAPDAVEDVILGHCYPSSEAPAIGRVVALDAGLPVTVPGHAGRPAVRVRPAGGHPGVPAGGQRRQRSRGRRRRREHEQRRVLLDRHALGRRPRRRQGARRAGARPHAPRAGDTTRCPAACWRPRRTCAGSTASRGRSRTNWRCRRISVRWRRRRTGMLAEEIIPVTVRTRQRRGGDRHRRASRAPTPRSSRWPS